MICDLCGRSDGMIIKVENPAHANDLRRSTHRHHHADCHERVQAHRQAEEQRTARELDARIAVLYAPTV